MSPITLSETDDGLAPPAAKIDASIRVLGPDQYRDRVPAWAEFVLANGRPLLSHHPQWLSILERGLRHRPYVIEAMEGQTIRGLLPLVLVKSALFGRFLVGLPYLNYGGVISPDPETAQRLIQRAIELADELKVRHLELRHENQVDHPRLTANPGMKVHMRRELPETAEKLWSQLGTKVRNQIRKGEKNALQVVWGTEDLLDEYYAVFSRNMRDLGTPVFGRKLFQTTLSSFPDRAELCVVRLNQTPIAAGLLLHGRGISEIPSASSLRQYNATCANMLMYWQILVRSIERGQTSFDFGRSSPDGPTYKFKEQWGAKPLAAHWSYYVRTGDRSDMRPDNPRNQRLIAVWRRLPVGLTKLMGPYIVRGIP